MRYRLEMWHTQHPSFSQRKQSLTILRTKTSVNRTCTNSKGKHPYAIDKSTKSKIFLRLSVLSKLLNSKSQSSLVHPFSKHLTRCQFVIAKDSLCISLEVSSASQGSLRQPCCCWRARYCCLINCNVPTGATALFPSSALVCADSVLPVWGSLCGVAVAADVNSLNTWLGTAVGITIPPWLEVVPGDNTGSSPINLFTWGVFRVLGPTWTLYNDTVASLAYHTVWRLIKWDWEFVFCLLSY